MSFHVGGKQPNDQLNPKMKTKHRIYKGRLISSFALAQLGDSEVTGTTYSVYLDLTHLKSGEMALSAHECLRTLADAKQFVDSLA